MKIVFTLSLCLLFQLAQAATPTLTLGVLLPGHSKDINHDLITRLGGKITQIINNSEDVTVGTMNDIVVFPVLAIEDTQVAEGGMQNLYVTTIDLSLFVKQVSNKMVYHSMSFKIKGSGNNKAQSISNAISQIRPGDERFKQFMSTAKNKILKYYTDNCGAILQKADNLAAHNDYEQAISLLQSIPIPVSACYTQAQQKSVTVYKQYQSVLCKQNVTKAKAAIAINDFDGAYRMLSVIDPTSSCYPEVSKIINSLSGRVDVKNKQDLDLEKQRLNAIRDISVAYYSQTIATIEYDLFIW